jgi:hypothetical protein
LALDFLVGLVVWLTIQYAPVAVAPDAQAPGLGAEGAIPIWAGYLTITAVSFLAVVFGLEWALRPKGALNPKSATILED